MIRIRNRWQSRQPGWLRRAAKDKEVWKSIALGLLAVSAAITLVFVVPVLYRTSTDASAGRRASEEVRRGNDAAACRGVFAGAVTDARARLDDVIAALDDARANLDVAQAAQQQAFVDLGVAALDQRGEPTYTAARSDIDATTQLVTVVQQQVADARDDVATARDALTGARTDQQALLDATGFRFSLMCAAGTG